MVDKHKDMTWEELKKEISKTSWFIQQVSKLSQSELEIVSGIVTGMNIQKSLNNINSA
ncbi:hypothetical protein [Thomasclavelia cocleata]|uniref:hypothetical protein n=1 Tax=Thomasclavelia cocleata TaxID=69824 RepID=UPI002432D496|nr:hypothetical protein [Thomasclavelia cocleata]